MSHESKSGNGAPWSIHEIMRIRRQVPVNMQYACVE